jgi:hypothetical protein
VNFDRSQNSVPVLLPLAVSALNIRRDWCEVNRNTRAPIAKVDKWASMPGCWTLGPPQVSQSVYDSEPIMRFWTSIIVPQTVAATTLEVISPLNAENGRNAAMTESSHHPRIATFEFKPTALDYALPSVWSDYSPCICKACIEVILLPRTSGVLLTAPA